MQLSDGNLFVVGGLTSGAVTTRTAESFNPSTNTWTAQGRLPATGTPSGSSTHGFYSYPGAAQLGTGRVLVTGHADSVYALFTPASGDWAPGNGLISERLQPLVLSLADGRVLVASGVDEGGYYPRRTGTYDDTHAAWATGYTRSERFRATGVQLLDGRVLVTSGIADEVYGAAALGAELYDPVSDTWAFTGAPRRARAAAALARLSDGRVLLIGGTSVRGFFSGTAVRTSSVELYDPTTGDWRDTGYLNIARSGHTATVLADGRVLVIGGQDADGKVLSSVEWFDPSTEKWTLTAPLSTGRASHVSALLGDGRVFVVGGTSSTGAILASSEEVLPGGFCAANGCVPESDDVLCAKQTAGCGPLDVTDACGRTRQVSCGACIYPATCGGAGIPARCGQPGVEGWQVEVLGSATGDNKGIVIEPGGEPAIAYVLSSPVGGPEPRLFLARRLATGWNTSPILDDILGGDVALARTREGALRVATRKRVVGSFSSYDVPVFLSWKEGRWWDDVVPSTDFHPPPDTDYLSMGLGPDDEPHLCTLDITSTFNTATLYCYGLDATRRWTRERVDVPGTDFSSPSVAVDGEGRPHVAYYDANQKRLTHAVRSASGWVLETVDASADVGTGASMVLDAQGHPHIAYRDTTNQDLKYARWTGTEWSLQRVDSTDDVGGTPALALDAQGRPHISYEDLTRHHLKYARWTGTQWNLSTVDASGTGGRDSALALDAAGRVHITYFSEGLRYARSPQAPTAKRAAPKR
ncbi:hypothetical protein LZ198_07315 [Myxococcus sp. K15C18031901]|nr:hypothetical protein [Myxococcus dinghuensis]